MDFGAPSPLLNPKAIQPQDPWGVQLRPWRLNTFVEFPVGFAEIFDVQHLLRQVSEYF